MAETKPDVGNDDILYEFPEGILRARAAMRRDLPALLASWWKRGKLACYTGDGLVAVSRSYLALIDEIIRRGLPDGEFIIARIEPGAVSEAEEWHEDRNRPE